MTGVRRCALPICYHQFCASQKERLKFKASEEERQREYSFLEYEKNEIDDANISEKEEEELEREFKRLANAEKLVENMGLASQCLCGGQSNAAALVSQALLCLQGVSEFDSELKGYFDTLVDLESIIGSIRQTILSVNKYYYGHLVPNLQFDLFFQNHNLS